MNYLLDENIPPQLIRAVAALHMRDHPADDVVSIREIRAQGTADEVWIHSLTQTANAWTIVGRDLMRQERALIRTTNLTWFILNRGWGGLTFWDLSWKLVKAWPDIVSSGLRSPGHIFRVSVNGKIEQGTG